MAQISACKRIWIKNEGPLNVNPTIVIYQLTDVGDVPCTIKYVEDFG